MATWAAIHNKIVSEVGAVSGLSAAPVPFTAEAIPEQLTNGGFIVRWESIDVDGFHGEQKPTAEGAVEIELLYRLTTDPNTGIGTAIVAAESVVSKLADDGLTSVDARIDPTSIDLEYPPDGLHVIARVRASVLSQRAI